MIALMKSTGPDCPRCGCNDSSVVRTKTRWMQVIEERACSYCGQRWNAPVPKPKKEKKRK